MVRIGAAAVSQSLFTLDAPPPRHTGLYARVAVERGIDALDAEPTLTYACATPAPAVGERVEVPLGRGSKLTQGTVLEVGGLELLGDFDPARVKPIARALGSVLPAPLLELSRWMATYYVCPLGMVLASMVPAAVKKQTGRKAVELISLVAGAAPAETAKPPLRRAWDAVTRIDAALFPMPLKELAGRAGFKTPRPIRALLEADLLASHAEDQVHARAMPTLDAFGGDAPLTLSEEQATAVEGIAPSLGTFATHLVRGVTGSGKTEVYLRLIARVLAGNGTAIVLVPEIALTPQTNQRFTQRFGSTRVAVLHSGLTAAQRNREWGRLQSGEARVVVGARSAIFAPLQRLALIIVDEEHDSSYKQDRLPRYNARDVAIKRGQLESACVVLGSATPSLESWFNAGLGRSTLWELPSRVGGAVLPQVAIVDLAMERRNRARAQAAQGLKPDARLHLLGPTLERALEETLEARGQAMLLLNRRGFAQYITCPDPACGFVLECDQCDATLVMHKQADLPAGGFVRCHHCLAEQKVPVLCPRCSKKLNIFGGGTQRVEDELVRKFASMGLTLGDTLLRLDSDSMRSAADYFESLARFASGQARVLLGTQMIAKGLDFPGVRLVGVIDADTSLNIPDFRAAERTFQLVSQVAGRAGRGRESGRVIIQTMSPTTPAITLAAAHDYRAFAQQELTIRQRSHLPPITRLARVVCRDEEHAKAREAAGVLVDALRSLDIEGLVVHGPSECTINRIANFYRWSLEVYAPRAGALQQALAHCRSQGLLKSDAKTAVDVDPVALM